MKKLHLLWGLILLAISGPALAVPSFARQTGQDCAACHIGSYGPQLTPYGMKFKMGGYTESDGKEGHIPLSAMLVESFTNTKKDQTEAAAPHFQAPQWPHSATPHHPQAAACHQTEDAGQAMPKRSDRHDSRG